MVPCRQGVHKKPHEPFSKFPPPASPRILCSSSNSLFLSFFPFVSSVCATLSDPHSPCLSLKSTITISLAMFASTLSLALALVPFVSAAVIDVQVGASGLMYSPEAIVCPLFLSRFGSPDAHVTVRALTLAIKWCSISTQRTTL